MVAIKNNTYIYNYTMLHTENVFWGGKLRVSKNVGGGGEGVYNALTFQKSRGRQELT